jgi:hypothetical protein
LETPQKLLQNWELLQKVNLDIPFVLKILVGLKQKNINLPWTLDEEELVKFICQ